MQTNIFRALQELLPSPQLTVATVIEAHDDGTTTIQYPGGSTQRVIGTGEAGQNAYIRNNRIEGPAPALTSITIEV